MPRRKPPQAQLWEIYWKSWIWIGCVSRIRKRAFLTKCSFGPDVCEESMIFSDTAVLVLTDSRTEYKRTVSLRDKCHFERHHVIWDFSVCLKLQMIKKWTLFRNHNCNVIKCVIMKEVSSWKSTWSRHGAQEEIRAGIHPACTLLLMYILEKAHILVINILTQDKSPCCTRYLSRSS